MMRHFFGLLSISGIVSFMVQPEPQFYILCGVLVTSVCGLISSWMSAKNEERRHKWDREDRERYRETVKADLESVRVNTDRAQEAIQRELAANTALTEETRIINLTALDAANHVNEKLVRIAESAAKEPR